MNSSWIPFAVVFIALLRLVSLSQSVDPPQQVHTVMHVEDRVFDPDMVVAIRPGPDQQPGVAGADDNRNGVIDDRWELGATHSDDQCVVILASQLESIPADQILILQRGANVGQQVDFQNATNPED
jgi:hypothetical protein